MEEYSLQSSSSLALSALAGSVSRHCTDTEKCQTFRDLAKTVPTNIFESSRKKEDFDKVLDDLIDNLAKSRQDFSEQQGDSQKYRDLVHAKNLLIVVVSYHCRQLSQNFDRLIMRTSSSLQGISTVMSGHVQQQQQQQFQQAESGYLLLRKMAHCVWKIYEALEGQSNVESWLNRYSTQFCSSELIGLLLQSIYLLKVLAVPKHVIGTTQLAAKTWSERCWLQVATPLMKVAGSHLDRQYAAEMNNSLSSLYLESYLRELSSGSASKISSNDEAIICNEGARAALVDKLRHIVESSARGNPQHFEGAVSNTTTRMSRKRSASFDENVAPPKAAHFLGNNESLDPHFGRLFQLLSIHNTAFDERNYELSVSSTILDGIQQYQQELPELVSSIVRQLLVAPERIPTEWLSGIEDEDFHFYPLLAVDQRHRAVDLLIPILYWGLTSNTAKFHGRQDWISICKLLLQKSLDRQVVTRICLFLCLIIRREQHQFLSESSLADELSSILDCVDLLNAVAGTVSDDPSITLPMVIEALMTTLSMAVSTQGNIQHQQVYCSKLARQPNILSALIRGTKSARLATQQQVMQIFWVISQWPENHRVLACHNGFIATMVHMARSMAEEPPSDQQSQSFIETSPGAGMPCKHLWKGRILKLAEAL